MKNKKPLFLLSLMLIFIVSCKHQILDSTNNTKDNEIDKSKKSFLILNVQDFSSRTILPQKGSYEDYEYDLYGTNAAGNQNQLQHWANYDEMKSSKVEIQTGDWIFELHAIKNSAVVLSGVLSATVVIGENTLSFELKEMSYGNGSLFIELYIPKNVFQKVEAILLDENGKSVSGFSQTLLPLESDDIKNKNKAVFQLTNIPKGYYLVRYYLYTNEIDSAYSAIYNTFVRIEPYFTSSGIEEISSTDSLYQVSIPIDHYEITKLPNKTWYYVGEKLSLDGLVLNACFADGSKKEIKNYTTSISNGTKLDVTDRKLVVAYGEFTKTIDLEIIPNTVNGVIVTVPSIEQDVNGLLTYSDYSNTFTAAYGYSLYEWWLDDTKLENTIRYFSIDTTGLSAGNHTLMLTVKGMNSKEYSATAEFVIYESTLSFIKIVIEEITEVKDLLVLDGTSFTASTGYEIYSWWFDDVEQTETATTFVLSDNLEPGHHTVTLIVEDSNGNYFSESKTVSITKDNLNLNDDSDVNTIYVTILNYDDEVDLLSYNSFKQSFVAKSGFSSYEWWIDDIKASEADSNYRLSNSNIAIGNHTLVLVVTDSSGKTFSATQLFTVTGIHTDTLSYNTAIYVILPKYQEIEDLIIYKDSTFKAKDGFVSYSWWVDDEKASQTTSVLNINIMNKSKGYHTLMLVVESADGKVFSSTAEIVIN